MCLTGCKKSLSQEARLEAQALTDPDEDKIYHANKIDDVSFMKKKSSVNKKNNTGCDDNDSDKKENIIVLDVQAAPKSRIIQVTDLQKPLVKKSSTGDALKNQKAQIKNLQGSIHSNLIKLFHHLKNRHGLNSVEDKKEVSEAKEALIADARQMTLMDHDPSPAENFLKELGNNTLLKTLVHSKSQAPIVSNDNTKSSDNNDNKTSDSKQDGESTVSVQKIEVKQVDKEPTEIPSHVKTNDTKSESKSESSSDKDEKQNKEHNKENKATSDHTSTKPSKLGVHNDSPTKVKTKDLSTKEEPKAESHDPYAEIAATPDDPKMPPNVKLPKETPFIPVGLQKPEEDDDSDRDDDRERRPEGGRGGGRGGGGGGSYMNDLPLPGKTSREHLLLAFNSRYNVFVLLQVILEVLQKLPGKVI